MSVESATAHVTVITKTRRIAKSTSRLQAVQSRKTPPSAAEMTHNIDDHEVAKNHVHAIRKAFISGKASSSKGRRVSRSTKTDMDEIIHRGKE